MQLGFLRYRLRSALYRKVSAKQSLDRRKSVNFTTYTGDRLLSTLHGVAKDTESRAAETRRALFVARGQVDLCRIVGPSEIPEGKDALKVAPWLDLLDRTLPPNLKSTTLQKAKASRSDIGKEYIPEILYLSRRECAQDLVCALAVQHGRWAAAEWVMEQLLHDCRAYDANKERGRGMVATIWSQGQMSLDDLTEHPINPIAPPLSDQSLDDAYGWSVKKREFSLWSKGRRALSQVWQVLGALILSAQDSIADTAAHVRIMHFVIAVLAQLHHYDSVPMSIYNYEPDTDRDKELQRSPMLYLLSTRIMTALSDVAWKKHWETQMAGAKLYGHELALPRVQPSLPQVGPQIWLELVLWAAIQGGWAAEASWIVSLVHQRSQNPDRRWSTISWDTFNDTQREEPKWTDVLKVQIAAARLNQSAAVGIAHGGISNVDLPERTLSREVIFAIMDGLVNLASTNTTLQGLRLSVVSQRMDACFDLLALTNDLFKAQYTTTLIHRVIESSALRDGGSKIRQSLLAKHPVYATDYTLTPSDAMSYATGDAFNPSPTILGHLYRNLYEMCSWGNLRGVRVCLAKIQNILDSNRKIHTEVFAQQISGESVLSRDAVQLRKDGQGVSLVLSPTIPLVVIRHLLEFVAQNKYTGLGRWLLNNNDVDVGIIPADFMKNVMLQPSILRVSVALQDGHIFSNVLKYLTFPVAPEMQHQLLQYQAMAQQWNEVHDILRELQTAEYAGWNPDDLATIAAAILDLASRSEANPIILQRATSTFMDVVAGRYCDASIPWESRRTQIYQVQVASQFARIVNSIRGGPFAQLKNLASQSEPSKNTAGRGIPCTAFNILIDQVSCSLGPLVARELYEQWCLPVEQGKTSPPTAEKFRTGRARIRQAVVVPDIMTIRAITRPIGRKLWNADYLYRSRAIGFAPEPWELDYIGSNIPAGRTLEQESEVTAEERDVLIWAVPIYQRFGFSLSMIEHELPRFTKLHLPWTKMERRPKIIRRLGGLVRSKVPRAGHGALDGM